MLWKYFWQRCVIFPITWFRVLWKCIIYVLLVKCFNFKTELNKIHILIQWYYIIKIIYSKTTSPFFFSLLFVRQECFIVSRVLFLAATFFFSNVIWMCILFCFMRIIIGVTEFVFFMIMWCFCNTVLNIVCSLTIWQIFKTVVINSIMIR